MPPPPNLVLYLAQAGVVLLTAAAIFRVRVHPAAACGAGAVALGVVLWESFAGGTYLIDALTFRAAGAAAIEGRNPYDSGRALNPPSAFALFALLALVPLAAYPAFMKSAILLAHGSMVVAGQASIGAGPQAREWKLPWPELLLLSAAVLLCVSTRYALAVGQIAFLTTLALMGALACRERGRPVWAGILLAVAATKFTTMLPFFLLFLRRQDRKTWVALIAAGLLLTFLTVLPQDLPGRLRDNFQAIRRAAGEGAVNDYSFQGPHSADLIGFDHAIYHLGVRDRAWVGALQIAAVGLLGAWVFRQLRRSPEPSPAGAASLVACYSVAFLYHRHYDLVILAIPLAYAAGRGRVQEGRAGVFYRLSALGIVVLLYLRLSALKSLLPAVQKPGLGARILEALVLPCGLWLALAVLFLLAAAERHSHVPPAVPEGTPTRS